MHFKIAHAECQWDGVLYFFFVPAISMVHRGPALALSLLLCLCLFRSSTLTTDRRETHTSERASKSESGRTAHERVCIGVCVRTVSEKRSTIIIDAAY